MRLKPSRGSAIHDLRPEFWLLRSPTAIDAMATGRGQPGPSSQGERLAVTVDVSEGRIPGASRMPRPITILAGEGQPGQQVSPIREQNVALGVTPTAGSPGNIRQRALCLSCRASLSYVKRYECVLPAPGVILSTSADHQIGACGGGHLSKPCAWRPPAYRFISTAPPPAGACEWPRGDSRSPH